MPKMGTRMPNMGTVRKHGNIRVKAAALRKAGLIDALFTKTQQRVLALFFGHTDRSFIQQEVIECAGSGSGAVRREVARLVESGLITVTILGSQKHYQANRDAPIFEELRGLITKTVALVDPLRAALRPLSKRIDVAILYGSVAKGEARADSDVDLLVV